MVSYSQPLRSDQEIVTEKPAVSVQLVKLRLPDWVWRRAERGWGSVACLPGQAAEPPLQGSA